MGRALGHNRHPLLVGLVSAPVPPTGARKGSGKAEREPGHPVIGHPEHGLIRMGGLSGLSPYACSSCAASKVASTHEIAETPIAQPAGQSRGYANRLQARDGILRVTHRGPGKGMFYNWLILARNSLLVCAFARRSISSSMASTGESGFKTLRSTQMRARSSFGMSSSSLRVPER